MRVEAFVLAIGWDGPLPRGMLDTFFEIDDMYGRMERKFLKELTKKKK
jgi:hypothetical protein